MQGKYNATTQVLYDGQVLDVQLDNSGRLITSAQGSVASGSTDSGNPVKVAAVYNSTMPTFTTGQRGDLQIGSRGALKVQVMTPDGNSAMADGNGLLVQYGFPGTYWYYAGVTGGITDTADVAAKAAAGASVRNYCSGIQFHNTSAVPSEIVIKDGSTVIWRGYAPAAMTQPADIAFRTPLRTAANTAMNVAMVTTATATRVSLQGWTGT